MPTSSTAARRTDGRRDEWVQDLLDGLADEARRAEGVFVMEFCGDDSEDDGHAQREGRINGGLFRRKIKRPGITAGWWMAPLTERI